MFRNVSMEGLEKKMKKMWQFWLFSPNTQVTQPHLTLSKEFICGSEMLQFMMYVFVLTARKGFFFVMFCFLVCLHVCFLLLFFMLWDLCIKNKQKQNKQTNKQKPLPSCNCLQLLDHISLQIFLVQIALSVKNKIINYTVKYSNISMH